MTEKPILFSAPMVRAILEGRKSQTRRIMKPQPDAVLDGEPYWHIGGYRTRIGARNPFFCPYGQPGDRLWVRETCRAEELPSGLDGVRYLADDCFIPIDNTEEACDAWIDLSYYSKQASPSAPIKTVPSIHMPRWVSRITLEITGIRVERLQDISESDALAEGIDPKFPPDEQVANAARMRYADIWESINGPGSWAANPWVWVVEFGRARHTLPAPAAI